MITLMLLLTLVWKVEGNTVEDWRESAFKIHSFDCSTPTMINKLHLSEVCFIPEKKLAEELAAAQPAWILGKEYIHEQYPVFKDIVELTRTGSSWMSQRSRPTNQ